MNVLSAIKRSNITLEWFLHWAITKIVLIVPSKLILSWKEFYLYPTLSIKTLDGKFTRISNPWSLMVLPIVTFLPLVYSVSQSLVLLLLLLRSICLVLWDTF